MRSVFGILTLALFMTGQACAAESQIAPPSLPSDVMSKLANVKRGARVRLLIHATVRADSAPVSKLVRGWNFENVASCLGLQVNGIDYVQLNFWSYDQLVTNDPTTIAAAGAICIDSPYIAVHVVDLNGAYSAWDSIFLQHK